MVLTTCAGAVITQPRARLTVLVNDDCTLRADRLTCSGDRVRHQVRPGDGCVNPAVQHTHGVIGAGVGDASGDGLRLTCQDLTVEVPRSVQHGGSAWVAVLGAGSGALGVNVVLGDVDRVAEHSDEGRDGDDRAAGSGGAA